MFHQFPFKKKKTNKSAAFAGGALIGGLIGSLAAIFLTPVSGRKARKYVGQRTQESVDWVTKEMADKKQMAAEGATRAMSKVEEGARKAKETLGSKADEENDKKNGRNGNGSNGAI